MSATKKASRTLNYNATVGALYLEVGGEEFAYWVDRLGTDFPGTLAVRLSKFKATERPGEPDHYDVTVGPAGKTCECKGHHYRGRCKHSDALGVLIERRMI